MASIPASNTGTARIAAIRKLKRNMITSQTPAVCPSCPRRMRGLFLFSLDRPIHHVFERGIGRLVPVAKLEADRPRKPALFVDHVGGLYAIEPHLDMVALRFD